MRPANKLVNPPLQIYFQWRIKGYGDKARRIERIPKGGGAPSCGARNSVTGGRRILGYDRQDFRYIPAARAAIGESP